MPAALSGRIAGESHAGTPPLVLLAAFPLDSRMFAEQLRHLSRHTTVIAMDPRGSHADLGQEPPSLDVMADDVVHTLGTLGYDKAIIGGVSLGGYVALAVADRHPESVAGLILADTRAIADSPEARQSRYDLATLAESAASMPDDERVHTLMRVAYPRLLSPDTTTDPRIIADIEGWLRDVDPRMVAWQLRAMAERPDRTHVLHRLDVPALVIAGERDEVIDPAVGTAMANEIPVHLRDFALLPGANHLSNLENPPAFGTAAARLVHTVRQREREHAGPRRPAAVRRAEPGRRTPHTVASPARSSTSCARRPR